MKEIKTTGTSDESAYKWLALCVVIIGTFMAILDTSIVNIAIPKMMAVFSATTDEIQWVVTGYMLTMGVVIPLTGFLGDTLGTKKVYVWALAVFTVGSAFCGFAWNNSSMVVARVIQAVGGGMIMPVGMAIIYQAFPLQQRGLAVGIWGIAAMAAPAIGPTLSGYMVEHLNWRLIFTINIPVGIFGILLAILLLKEMNKKPFKKFDLTGFITSGLGFGTLLLALSEGNSEGWTSFYIVSLFVLSAGSLALFAINELTSEEPMLDLRLLKNRTYTLSIIISSLLSIGLFGGLFLMPIFLENIRGYTAMQTGMLMFPGAVATGIVMPISGKLFDKYGAKPIVSVGLIIIFWSTFLLHKVNMDTSADWIRTIFFIRGIGIGLSMMPTTTAGMNSIPFDKVGRASALMNVIRQVAGSIGIAVITTILQRRQDFHLFRLSEQVSDTNPLIFESLKLFKGLLLASGKTTSEAEGMAPALLSGVVQKVSAINAIGDTFLMTALIGIMGLPLIFFMQGKSRDEQIIPKLE